LARLDKPIGTMLLLWPCCWSTALAAPAGCLPDAKLLALFATGSFVMRGAGCTINDMWDADFDKSVTRTKSRPLASGELTQGKALGFLAAQLTTGLSVLLSLPHTSYTFQVGAASLPLVVAYPLMKRYTNWPQLVLGMTFNWGALIGWASVHGSIDWTVIGPLYVSGIAWTLVYDTIYAHQDKVDDSKLGLKSTALYFGENTKPILHGFSALAAVNWMVAGCALGLTSPLYYGGCAAAYSHLAWQVHTADLDDPSNLAERFKSNNRVGAIVFATCVVGNLAAAT
jgi:4-hydroxybenzoate polyprenyltransferase